MFRSLYASLIVLVAAITPATTDAQLPQALDSALAVSPTPLLRPDEWTAARALYQRHALDSATVPLWLDSLGVTRRSRQLRDALAAAESRGLRPQDYAVATIDSALAAAKRPAAPEAIARADVLLSAGFVSIIDDLLIGRVAPRSIEPDWHIGRERIDLAGRADSALALIASGRTVSSVLDKLRPDFSGYQELTRGLNDYRALARTGWPTLDSGAVLGPGAKGKRVAVLRKRLAAEWYLPRVGLDSVDHALSAAVMVFQRSHGLPPDGMVGEKTRAALNVSAIERVRQIEDNLERLRWLPADLGSRFIIVNIPSFTLYAYDYGRRALTMPVVVGDEMVERRTPVFADTMEYVEFAPYWNVTRHIAVDEILPAAVKDRDWLATHHFQLLRGGRDDAPEVDPHTLSDSDLFSPAYRVRQLPGPDNALGHVKFMFPNDFNVYLHDTPDKSRFGDQQRSASHGCVRVGDPVGLAAYALGPGGGWPPAHIESAMAATERQRVNVRPGVAVYLIYLTAIIREGRVAFRDDIYDRDHAMYEALATTGRARP